MGRRSQFEIWESTFKPQPNAIATTDRGFEGKLFETFGAEHNYVQTVVKEEPDRVWTVVDADGKWYIAQGYHYVNRVGYLITEKPFNPDDPKQVARYQHKDVFYL